MLSLLYCIVLYCTAINSTEVTVSDVLEQFGYCTTCALLRIRVRDRLFEMCGIF